jgi:hypothetical protein
MGRSKGSKNKGKLIEARLCKNPCPMEHADEKSKLYMYEWYCEQCKEYEGCEAWGKGK